MRRSDPFAIIMVSLEDGVTENTIRAAENRTRPLLENWRLMDYDIKRLLVSAYLQGCRDMAEVVIKQEKGSA